MIKELFEEKGEASLAPRTGNLGTDHVPEWSDLPKKDQERMEDKPEISHLFLNGHVRPEVIEKFKKPLEPATSYVRSSKPAQESGWSGEERVAIGNHFLKCLQCRGARDGETLF